MTATHPTYLIYCGDTWQFHASLHDDEGAALNLSGADIKWRLRNTANAIVSELSVGDGIQIASALAGQCIITLSGDKSGLLAAGNYSDETWVKTQDNIITTQAVGVISARRADSVAGPLPDLMASLDALKAARRSGQRRVRIEGFETEWRDDSEMARAITALESEIARTQGSTPIRNINIRSKGWN
jgi:hypothetical protein